MPPDGATQLPIGSELQGNTDDNGAQSRTGENLIAFAEPTIAQAAQHSDGESDDAHVCESGTRLPEHQRALGMYDGGIRAQGRAVTAQLGRDVARPEEVEGGNPLARWSHDGEPVPDVARIARAIQKLASL